MADPFSVAAGAVGVVSLALQLLGGCVKGFVLLSTAQNIGRDAPTICCMVELQEASLINWAQSAGLLTDDGTLDRRLNLHLVEETLLQLRNLLLDTDHLKRKYGLSLVPRPSNAHLALQQQTDAKRVSTGVSDETRHQIMQKARISLESNAFKRLWWAVVDKEKMEKLVADIHFLVRELWHLLEPFHHHDVLGSMDGIRSNILKLNNRFDQLMSLNEAISLTLKALPNPQETSLKPFAVSAEVKALRVGLDQDGRGQASEQKFDQPRRQELLRRLNRLSRLNLSNFKAMKKHQNMGLADYEGRKVFVEWKIVNPALRSKILPRVENIAALLNIPKVESFRSLTCQGIIEEDGKVGFIFEHPFPDGHVQPLSLVDLLNAKDDVDIPSLSDRLRLALRIAQTVQSLHQAGWLHKNLRSENILFFDSEARFSIDVASKPLLVGFSFARQDSPTEISEQPSADPRQDIYRHPAAMGEPSTSYSALMDVYSFGTILLEIAEWRPLRYIVKSLVDVNAETVPLSKLAGVQEFLLSGRGKGGTSKVRARASDIYADACLMCLKGTMDESDIRNEEEHDLGSSLIDEVVQKLERCNI